MYLKILLLIKIQYMVVVISNHIEKIQLLLSSESIFLVFNEIENKQILILIELIHSHNSNSKMFIK